MLVDVAFQVVEDCQLEIEAIEDIPEALFLNAETIVLVFNIIVDWVCDGGAALLAALRTRH